MKIKSSNNSSELKGKLLQIFLDKTIKVTKLLQVSDGFLCFCASPADADKIFSTDIYTKLSSVDCDTIMPQQLRCRRTVMLHQLDESILHHSASEIKNEISSANEWSVVKEVVLIPNSKLIKVIFQTSEMSDRCLKSGLLIFKLYIPTSSMTRKEYYSILTCYRCYKLEDHATSQCTESAKLNICFLCASSRSFSSRET